MPQHDWKEPPKDWAEEQARRVAVEVRRLRGRGRSAQWLANRTAELGYHVTRSVISDLEIGRRRYVTTAELIVLARALDTAPIALMYPHPYWDEIEAWPKPAQGNPYLPLVPKIWAVQWFSGLVRTVDDIPFTEKLFNMPMLEAMNYDANLKALERARTALRLDKIKSEKERELARARHDKESGEREVSDTQIEELVADIAGLQSQIDEQRALGDRDLLAESSERLFGRQGQGGQDGG